MKKKLVVFGAGEFGLLIFNIVSQIEKYKIVAFGDDDKNKIGKKLKDSSI